MSIVAKDPKSSENNVSFNQTVYWDTYPVHTVSTPLVAGGGWVTRSNSYAQGYNNSDYRALLAKGRLVPFTPWEQYYDTYTLGVGQNDVHSTSQNRRYWTTTQSFVYWYYASLNVDSLVPTVGELRNLALLNDTKYFVQAAASKIYSRGWDSLTFVAELSKTMAMFRGIMSRLISLAKAGKLENMYLESRYGWRTLIYDLKDLNKAITSLNEKRTRFFERTGSTRTDNTSVTYTATNAAWADSKVVVDTEMIISLRGSVVSDISPPNFQFNPVTTAWELARFSFVIDWALNVGQFLEACSFLALSREHYAAGGVHIDLTRNIAGSVTAWKNGFSGQHYFNSSAKAIYTSRTPQTVSTIPQLRLRLDWLKSLDLVALLVQAIRRK